MYTSEIRETDAEGRPVAVSPELLARVRAADDALRERLSIHERLEYTGRWNFPDIGRAQLALAVRVPNEPEPFAVSLPFARDDTDLFSMRAVHSVLRHASDVIQEQLSRGVRKLLAADVEDDENGNAS
jgi:hypothetical protein